MSYSTEIALILADKLAEFGTLKQHQLAGHVANIDFWIDEVRHCLAVIDGYGARIERIRVAEKKYTKDPLELTKRLSDDQLRTAKRSLKNSVYKVLVHCHNEGLIEESRLRSICDGLDIGVDRTDLRVYRGP